MTTPRLLSTAGLTSILHRPESMSRGRRSPFDLPVVVVLSNPCNLGDDAEADGKAVIAAIALTDHLITGRTSGRPFVRDDLFSVCLVGWLAARLNYRARNQRTSSRQNGVVSFRRFSLYFSSRLQRVVHSEKNGT